MWLVHHHGENAINNLTFILFTAVYQDMNEIGNTRVTKLSYKTKLSVLQNEFTNSKFLYHCNSKYFPS